MKKVRASFLRQWSWPILLSLLTIVGLLSALLGGGGIWWPVSWFTLVIPIGVITKCWLLRGDS